MTAPKRIATVIRKLLNTPHWKADEHKDVEKARKAICRAVRNQLPPLYGQELGRWADELQ